MKSNTRVPRSVIVVSIVLIWTTAVAAPDTWTAYLRGPTHPSFNPAATAFEPTTATKLRVDWTFPASPLSKPIVASPTVSGGVVYIGANTGDFYAIDETLGTEKWHRFLGDVKQDSCFGEGISSTAAVAADASRGGQLTVYVGGGDGYLYALRATDGVTVWRRLVADVSSGGYNWASPNVINGHVYMGISSDCDNPLVRGGIKDFDQASGTLLHTYWAVPSGSVGGSVWTSPAAEGTSVWATIGNQPEGDSTVPRLGDCFAIVRLDAGTLTRQDRWFVPGTVGTDLDWGSSPTLFTAALNGTATRMVGAAQKNGKYYAFRANNLAAGPVWSQRLGAPGDEGTFETKGTLLAAAIWDFNGKRLFVGSNETTIGGVTYPGSMRQLDPATGRRIWQTPLQGIIMGSPTMCAGGIIAAGTYNQVAGSVNFVYLINAANGAIVKKIQTNALVFAQPVFADTHLFVATTAGTLTAYSAVGP